jgi:hypothetical protein
MYSITGPEALSRAAIAEQIGVGIGVDVTFEQCTRAEAEALLQPAMGEYAKWYLDQVQAGIDAPQQANHLAAEWAAQHVEAFR